MTEDTDQHESIESVEVVNGLPVVAERPGVLESTRFALVPARQAAALAATGFVAGAATAAVVTRRRSRSPLRRRKRKTGSLGEIVASNSFLVDVHLLRRD
ncbi:MAG TPA: hypothetical protein VES79_02035 [Solirubrobacteraceae bacterium]|nr:hypothetical protein [Solirubrobacteraceae bacterium]